VAFSTTSDKGSPLVQAAINAFKLPDIRRRLLYTLALLLVFRFVAHIPVPGVNREELRRLFEEAQFLGLLDLFSGGAMANFSIVAMGVYPYITATIIMQLLTPVIPALKEISREGGEAGRMRMNQYMRLATVPLAALQAFGQASLLSQLGIIQNFGLFNSTTFLNTLAIIASMTAGTMFLVWLGELITENGIGQGISLIIFAGIVANLPSTIGQAILGQTGGTALLGVGLIGIMSIIIVVSIVVMYEAQRRIPVHYAKRIRGNRQYGGQTTHIPLKINSAGMIPLIFAISILIFPSTVASYFQYSDTAWVSAIANFIIRLFDSQAPLYWILYFLLVVGFTYFYTAIVFQQQNIPEILQKNGGFIPGIRPGRPTADFLNHVIVRVTLAGALFLGLIAVAPFIIQTVTGIRAFTLSSTGMLIVVGVVQDTMKNLEAQLLMRQYQGFLR
jgi:preprotein translocase subunit SecY